MIPELEFTPTELQSQALGAETLQRATTLFNASGCLQLKGLFPTGFIHTLREAYLERYQSYFRAGKFDDAKPVGTGRYQVAVEFSAPFNAPQLYASPLILPILQALLGSNLFLGIFGSVTSLPGAEAQHRHRDNPLLFSAQINRFLPPFAINLFVPLVDFNERTGTTRLFPGTHVKSGEEAEGAPGFDPMVPCGSCLLADYRLFHQGTANISEEIRPLLFLAYHRPWFKDYHNHKAWPFFRMSEAEHAGIPAEHRSLFAWMEHYRIGLY